MFIIFRYLGFSKLKIIFIGPELIPLARYGEVRLCNKCKKDKKQLDVDYEAMTYQEFAKKKPAAPDLQVQFNCGFHDDDIMNYGSPEKQEFLRGSSGKYCLKDMWKPQIEALRGFGKEIPLLITAFDEKEAQKDKEYCCSLHNLKCVLDPDANPFQSPLWLPDSPLTTLPKQNDPAEFPSTTSKLINKIRKGLYYQSNACYSAYILGEDESNTNVKH